MREASSDVIFFCTFSPREGERQRRERKEEEGPPRHPVRLLLDLVAMHERGNEGASTETPDPTSRRALPVGLLLARTVGGSSWMRRCSEWCLTCIISSFFPSLCTFCFRCRQCTAADGRAERRGHSYFDSVRDWRFWRWPTAIRVDYPRLKQWDYEKMS